MAQTRGATTTVPFENGSLFVGGNTTRTPGRCPGRSGRCHLATGVMYAVLMFLLKSECQGTTCTFLNTVMPLLSFFCGSCEKKITEALFLKEPS
jgi:hypothetical protein